ncbi:MAG TPA: ferritin-like domain-containing protein [Chitinophagaceae bacterium]|nr:ferritin-like domain-containing protein [Chitinophagaceae bacterium]
MAQTKSNSKKSASKSSKSSQGRSKSSTQGSNGSSNKSSQEQSTMLEELFLEELKDIYWAEKHLLKALPKMEKAATSEELKQSFADHLEVTKEQVTRLEEAFELLGEKAQGKKCEAMDGLTKEAEGIIEDTEAGSLTRDVGLIMAAQKVEHYEIATYGSLAQLAKTLGKTDLAALMVETLEEEKEADQLLTNIAENNINVEATAE